MKKRRLIPIILIKNGNVVQSRNFKYFQNIGNPIASVKRCSEWGSDELIILDISRDFNMNFRQDLKYKTSKSFDELINEISKVAFMPLAAGGKIEKLSQIEKLLLQGADKVVINTKAIFDNKFIKQASQEFGSQCIIISIDVKKYDNEYYVYSNNGQVKTDINIKKYLKIVEENNAGEVMVNSIDNDGKGQGFDLDLIKLVENNINLPQICCGGAGEYNHFLQVAKQTNVDGIAAANFFQHIDQSVYITKKKLFDKNLNFRKPKFAEI